MKAIALKKISGILDQNNFVWELRLVTVTEHKTNYMQDKYTNVNNND